jgi:hypothetical protein
MYKAHHKCLFNIEQGHTHKDHYFTNSYIHIGQQLYRVVIKDQHFCIKELDKQTSHT